jgi:hypothetical protein
MSSSSQQTVKVSVLYSQIMTLHEIRNELSEQEFDLCISNILSQRMDPLVRPLAYNLVMNIVPGGGGEKEENTCSKTPYELWENVVNELETTRIMLVNSR